MNVLLLSDFSPVAINATHYAMDFLKDKQVHFYLLNIYEPGANLSEKEAKEKKLATLATLKERKEKLQARSNNPLHKISSHYVEDTLVNAARKFVVEHNIDLIAMGAVGRKLQHATILGNHTFEIMCKIKCNILAVPEERHFAIPQNLLMPLDYTSSFSSRNLRFLQDSEVFKAKRLSVRKIGDFAKLEPEVQSQKKEAFQSLQNLKIDFSALDQKALEEKTLWKEVQKEYDLITLLGKNIVICDKLLNNKHGLYSTVPNRLPILLLHD